MGLRIVQRTGDVPQIRLEMERAYVPISGYLDGISPEGFPIEVKSYYSSKVDKELANGNPPALNYLHQLAVQMDFLGVCRGVLVSVNRSNGNIFFNELNRVGTDSLVFFMGESAAGIGNELDDEENGGADETFEVGTVTEFDLGAEYARWRRLMEDHIIPLKEPPLDYEYRPAVTPELLAKYPDDKIKKMIRGDRVLSDHRYQPQYSSYKTLWAETEAKAKGFRSVAELCAYSDADIRLAMEYLNVEWKTDKNGKRKLFKKKGTK